MSYKSFLIKNIYETFHYHYFCHFIICFCLLAHVLKSIHLIELIECIKKFHPSRKIPPFENHTKDLVADIFYMSFKRIKNCFRMLCYMEIS